MKLIVSEDATDREGSSRASIYASTAAIPLVLAQLGHNVSVLASPDILHSRPEFSKAFLPDAVSRIGWLSIDDPRVLLKARGVLRDGGLVLGFIDLASRASRKTAEVDFLGRRMRASYALPYLASIANTPILSACLTSESGPRFTLRLGDALPAPARDERALQRTLQVLFRDAERQVLDHRGQWLGWRQWRSRQTASLRSHRPSAASHRRIRGGARRRRSGRQAVFRDAERQVVDHRDQWLGWRHWRSQADGHPRVAPPLGSTAPAQ